MSKPPCGCSICKPPYEPWNGKPKPCAPRACKPKPEGVLLPKIIGCEHRSIPCLETELCLQGLPPCATPPFKLTMVQQSGAQPWWTPLEENHHDKRLHIKVFIPVCCQVCDACGELHAATAVICVECSLRPPCPPNECWRHSLYVVPCIRLLDAECCSCDLTFAVRLQATLDIYLLKPEACMVGKCPPPCPELPLYPPPVTPPCWPQCPEAQAPCGWPKQG